MRLVIDIGNTRIKWGWSEARGKVEGFSASTSVSDLINTLDGTPAPDSIWIADVGHSGLAYDLQAHFLRLKWPSPLFAVSHQIPGILHLAYECPGTLGVDRFLALLASVHEAQLPQIIISAGTAVTVDGLLDGGLHRGGVILPGLHSMYEQLCRSVPVLRNKWDPELKQTPWANDTLSGLSNGLRYAWAGAIEKVVEDMEQGLPGVKVLITGGDGALLKKWLSRSSEYDELLILRGLSYL